MKNSFYRPEHVNTEEFFRILDAMREDFRQIQNSDEDETAVYLAELLPQARPLVHNKEMCFFGLDDPNHMPGDARVDFFYGPTYLAAAMIIRALNRFPDLPERTQARGIMPAEEWKDRAARILNACTGRGFQGSGFDSYRELLRCMDLFVDAGVFRFLEKFGDLSPKFTELFRHTWKELEKDSLKDSVIRGFGEDFTEKVKALVQWAKMGDGCRYYLAYGSNIESAQMLKRCPSAELVGTTMLKDWRLMFKKSGSGYYLTIEEAKGKSLPAVIWKVSPEGEKMLDRYEGFPRHYYKKDVYVDIQPVDGSKSRPGKAFIYVLPSDREFGWPREEYMDRCQRGYTEFGFDRDILWEAFRYSDQRKEK